MPLSSLGKMLMICGGLLFFFGLLAVIGGRFGIGQLPGDIAWKRGNTSVYFPIVTCIVASVVLTVVLNLLLRLFR